jgi:hypothetical protein
VGVDGSRNTRTITWTIASLTNNENSLHGVQTKTMKRLTIRSPIPSNTDPEYVIKALHNHENVLDNNPMLKTWNKTNHKDKDKNYGLFFSGRSCTDQPSKPVAYAVTQRAPYVSFLGPWFTKEVESITLVQDTEHGARSEVELVGGAMVWAEWWVQESAGEGWEISNVTRIEGSARSMVFVRETVTTAYIATLKGILSAAGVKGEDEVDVTWSTEEKGNWMGISFA